MGLSIDIAVEHDGWLTLGDLDALAARCAESALREARADDEDRAELSIVLCDDAFIQDLNTRWRGQAKPTNVLSFPVDEATRSRALGDVVVAWETCVREADEQRRSRPDYLAHLLVHGILHLLGYDHETDEEAELMEATETRALAALGIASPYEDAQRPRVEP